MPSPSPTEFKPLAGLAALIFPGAGHLLLGRPRRAALAATGVLGLFFFGLLVGGIDAVDSTEPFPTKFWFVGESLVGAPTFIADTIHKARFKAHDPGTGALRSGFPGEHRVVEGGRAVWEALTDEQAAAGLGPPNVPGLGRINEIAMLSIALGGMLNLIVFLDALMPAPFPEPDAARKGSNA